jgi:hypothetical protein
VKKRINSTGRKKLDSQHIDIRVQVIDGQPHPTFTAKFDFTGLPTLNKDSKIYVEPYFKTSSMRFDFGTVSSPSIPADTTLSELDINESFLFRVKVVDESGIVGRILADANGIRPRTAEDDDFNRKPLLPLVHKDLGERIWELGYDPDAGPELQISSKLADLSGRLKSDPLLQGAIYPEAFRRVLNKLIDADAFGEEDSWIESWRVFILKLTGRDLGENGFEEGEAEDFIDDAVIAFSGAHSFKTRAVKFEEVVA